MKPSGIFAHEEQSEEVNELVSDETFVKWDDYGRSDDEASHYPQGMTTQEHSDLNHEENVSDEKLGQTTFDDQPGAEPEPDSWSSFESYADEFEQEEADGDIMLEGVESSRAYLAYPSIHA